MDTILEYVPSCPSSSPPSSFHGFIVEEEVFLDSPDWDGCLSQPLLAFHDWQNAVKNAFPVVPESLLFLGLVRDSFSNCWWLGSSKSYW